MAEVGVWVSSRQRWVSGINRKTTCDDVIEVLVRGSELAKLDTGQSYAIMERWRRVERPLDGRSRILKIWNAWGDAQNEVRFTLRRVDWDADSGRGSPSSSGTYRKRKHHHRNKLPSHHRTVHPKRLAQQLNHVDGAGSEKLPETIERLMKLILCQGETIQTQLRRLHDREHQIEHLEGETHRSRVETLGANYLLETYLNGLRSNPEEDSGVVTDQTPPAASPNVPEEENFEETKDMIDEEDVQDLQARVELWEKLVRVNKRLEHEEEGLVRLHIKIRRQRNKEVWNSAALQVLPEEELDQEDFQLKNTLLEGLERARIESERGSRELEQTCFVLAETDSLLEARRHYLWRLQAELDASDKETGELHQEMVTSQHRKVPEHGRGIQQTTSCNDTDSNSDTGLSSLHSSSEEGVYVLDTLV